MNIYSSTSQYDKLDLGDGQVLHVRTKFTYGESADLVEALFKLPEKPKIHDLIRANGFIGERVIVGWEGVKDESGKAVEFNVENVKKLSANAMKQVADYVVEKLSDKDKGKKKEN